jgi:diguanylate cyclase (GGDEF)-like protein/PAS domain S-box-containing protein
MLDALLNPECISRGDCYVSTPELLWTAALADGVIAAAFYSVPPALWFFLRRRPDLRHKWLLALFGVFMFACGSVHLLDIWHIWFQHDVLKTVVTVITAALSIVCAASIWPLLPKLIALPSPKQFQEAYATLLERHTQLAASENRFRVLIEASDQGIWMVDRDAVTLFANPALCEMLGYPEGIAGRKVFEFVFPEDLVFATKRFGQRLAGDGGRYEFRWRRADGTALDTEVSTSLLLSPEGTIDGVIGIVTDMSERMAMGKELQRLNLELGQRVEERTRELEESNRELAREIVVREYVQAELSASNERLNHYLAALQRHTDDISRLNELADQLNACESRRELIQVLQSSCLDLFGTTGGALFEASDDRLDLLEFGWGDCAGLEGSFAPEQCLAMRMGKAFPASVEQESGTVCAHRPSLLPSLCVPLHSRGALVGLLLLQRHEAFWTGEAVSDRQLEQLLRALAEHTALALDNLSLRERLREQSLSDPLTGLFNRRYLFEQMDREMAAWERSRRPFALMLIDIDHFKKFNDRYGHAIGDAVLIEVSDLLREYTRRSDLACRLGGEEFVVLMTGAEQSQAIRRAEAIREAVKKIRLPGVSEPISISAGVAVYPEHGDEQQGLLRAADQALYVSKRTGRDRTSLAAV